MAVHENVGENLEENKALVRRWFEEVLNHENFQVFDFKLDADDMAAIAKLDSAGARMGPDPMTASF